ncbi:hypothetical protein OBBRIDRAFT_59472 [Obba rivulosa]|uniref:Uncharacterized protein n=1 Tax=Obba rivulosa TaxID=1052685 RepID=A0A8E2DJB5_9APHY|nr:hypothetical protein OBBRIDRAFT_59472 [Obba rivulosa]
MYIIHSYTYWRVCLEPQCLREFPYVPTTCGCFTGLFIRLLSLFGIVTSHLFAVFLHRSVLDSRASTLPVQRHQVMAFDILAHPYVSSIRVHYLRPCNTFVLPPASSVRALWTSFACPVAHTCASSGPASLRSWMFLSCVM